LYLHTKQEDAIQVVLNPSKLAAKLSELFSGLTHNTKFNKSYSWNLGGKYSV